MPQRMFHCGDPLMRGRMSQHGDGVAVANRIDSRQIGLVMVIHDHFAALKLDSTMAFVVLAAAQLFYSLSMRSATKSIFQVGLFTNKPLIGAIIAGFVLQLGVISIPFLASAFKVQNLSLQDWGLVFGFALIPLTVNELIKVGLRLKEKAA